jgi:hypothetical protein
MTVREERIEGWATYLGPREEIADLLEEHARKRSESLDYFTAAAMQRGAEEIRHKLASVFSMTARYRVEEEGDEQASEKVDADHA